MARIKYKSYSFNRPPHISNDDYDTLKEILTEQPEININAPSNFLETFKAELIILGIGAGGLLIVSLDLAEWLNWVGGIPAFFAFSSIFSTVPSLLSYLGYISDKSIYYSKLKRDIIKSKNYTEFTKLRNKR